MVMIEGCGKAESPNRAEVFITLAMTVVSSTDACKETPYPCSTGASLPPCPYAGAWEVSYHSPVLGIARPHISLPQEEPSAMREGQDLPSQGLGAKALA